LIFSPTDRRGWRPAEDLVFSSFVFDFFILAARKIDPSLIFIPTDRRGWRPAEDRVFSSFVFDFFVLAAKKID
jgi:hypothetical protein